MADELRVSVPRRLPPPDTSVRSQTPAADPHVVPVQFEQGGFRWLDADSSSNLSLDSFRLDQYDQTGSTRLDNDFSAFPEFTNGILVFGDDVAMKIGGYIKADLIKDFNAIDSTDSFDTTTIPTTGPDRDNARFHARQSRLSFDTRWRTQGEVPRAFLEFDFFGGEPLNSTLRLRHAYGTVGNFTAGKTWTTFTDPSAVPQTLDNEGGVSNVNRRQGLVRWDQPVWDDFLSIAVALEDPRVMVESPSPVMGDGRTEFPDFITRVRIDRDWGEFQAAYVLRTIGFQPTGGPVINETGWGLNFTGSVLVMPQTEAYYQITFGDGIGSYRGSPDIVATGTSSAEILHSFGWMVGVHHQWNDSLTSNFTFSQLSLDDVPGQSPTNLRSTTYLAVNLIANPYRRVFYGAEYLYGIRDDVSGAQGAANRLQVSFGFFLP